MARKQYNAIYSYDHNSFLCGRCGSPVGTPNPNKVRVDGLCNRCAEEFAAAEDQALRNRIHLQQQQTEEAAQAEDRQAEEKEEAERAERGCAEWAEDETDFHAGQWYLVRRGERFDRESAFAALLHRKRTEKGLPSDPPDVPQRQCPACSKEVPAALTYCPHCKTVNSSSKPLRCPRCGHSF